MGVSFPGASHKGIHAGAIPAIATKELMMDTDLLKKMREHKEGLAEIMDRASICAELFSEKVGGHESCDLVPELKVLATHAQQLLFEVYQMAGCAYFIAAEDEEDKVSKEEYYNQIANYDAIEDLLHLPDDFYDMDRDFEDWNEEEDGGKYSVNPEEDKRRAGEVRKALIRLIRQKYIEGHLTPEEVDEHNRDYPEKDDGSGGMGGGAGI